MSNQEEKNNKEHAQDKSKKKKRSVDLSKESKDGAYNVSIRNKTVYLIYRRMAFVMFLSFLAALVSGISFLMISGKKVPPQYIPLKEDNRLVPLISLSKPNVDDGVVAEFALDALEAIGNYDYLSWQTQVNKGRDYFTNQAWKDYYQEFEKSNVINTVTLGKMIVKTETSGNVIFDNQGVLDGENLYIWRVSIPIKIGYFDHSPEYKGLGSSLSSEGTATFYIQRTSLIDSPQGIAVRAYRFTPKEYKK